MYVKKVLNGFEGSLYANKLSIPYISDFDNLACDEKFVAKQMHNWVGIMFEKNFAQYQMGLLTDGYWQQQEDRIKSWWESSSSNCLVKYARATPSFLTRRRQSLKA